MLPPLSANKLGSKTLQQHIGEAQPSEESQPILTNQPLDLDRHIEDLVYIGLHPNCGNCCYQNPTLQSLLGLCLFLGEMASLTSRSGEGLELHSACPG